MDHQIIRDHATNRSRGFGFIIFDSEQVVDDLLANGNMIDLAGSQVSWVQCLPQMSVWILILDFSISQVAIYIFLGDMYYRFQFFFFMLSLHFFLSLYYHYGVNFTLGFAYFAAEVFYSSVGIPKLRHSR